MSVNPSSFDGGSGRTAQAQAGAGADRPEPIEWGHTGIGTPMDRARDSSRVASPLPLGAHTLTTADKQAAWRLPGVVPLSSQTSGSLFHPWG